MKGRLVLGDSYGLSVVVRPRDGILPYVFLGGVNRENRRETRGLRVLRLFE